MTTTVATGTPVDVELLAAELSLSTAKRQTRGCVNPIRLQGSSVTIDTRTGEVVGAYSSDNTADGHVYVRCGNRRAAVCPSCSREYKGDAWHVIMCGLTGGHGVPEAVTTHPSVFVTLTAPSFGAVHRATGGKRGKSSPCRVRRDRPVCPHGRPLSCTRRHTDEDRFVGQPLCRDCYDYAAHVAWQWFAPELWRRTTIALRRQLARTTGRTVKEFGKAAKLSYTKVTEFQARGIVHFHAVIRLDGPDGPDHPPLLDLTADGLTSAVLTAAEHVYVDAPVPGGELLRLRWGTQIDTRTITPGAGRNNTHGPAHPAMVGAYLSKYLTKGVEDFGLPGTRKIRHHLHARAVGASTHAVKIITVAEQLARHDETYARIADRYNTLGYRGHPITKSRDYGVTFGSRRQARRTWRRHQARLSADTAVRDVLDIDPNHDDTTSAEIVIGTWRYAGRGYLDIATATAAVMSATHARIRAARTST